MRAVHSWRIAALVCVATLACCVAARAAPAAGEYQVKAAYLFNFGQFVEWPARSDASPGAPFVIGIVGADPFGEALENAVRGESLGGRPYLIKRFRSAAEIEDSDILFIPRTEEDNLEEILATLRGRHVLTVTDIEGAEHRGAVIALFKQNNRIRMRINLQSARAHHLVISSKLLRPAEVIGHEGGT